MRIGDLTERLAFQKNTVAVDAQGGRSSSWATFSTVWGQVTPLSGREAIQAASVASVVSYRALLATQQLEAAAVSVTSITRSSTTATVTAAAVHGLITGEYARIAGAVETAYNGKVAVTVTNTTVYTYTVAGSPTSPATGTITCTRLLPIVPTMRITWTPSWDSGQAAKVLQIHAVRLIGRAVLELDLGEAA